MIDELGFDAVFIGVGAGYPTMLSIPGDSLNGVLSANELLTRCNLMRARDFPNYDTPLPIGKRVAVVGAGNTAMDAMRVSLRLGAEKVYCVYRRSRTEAPARRRKCTTPSRKAWSSTGSPIRWRCSTTARATCAACAACAWSWASPTIRAGGGRCRSPAANSISRPTSIVYAIGTNANPIMGQTSKLKLNKRGYIATDDNLATSVAGVFAGGDIVTGAATVIEAMGAGRKAARSMKAYLGIREPAGIATARRHPVRHRRRRARLRRVRALA